MLPAMTATESDAVSAIRRALRVLVVDDHPDIVMTLLAVLRNAGYNAEGFASAQAAVKEFRTFDPAVIISDIAMPFVSGWDLAKQVRRTMGEKRPMLIAITGQYTTSADKAASETSGFNYYLTKPCDPNVLLALLEKATQ